MMPDLMGPTRERLEDLQTQLRGHVRLVWATVTASSPLRIQVDGDDDPLPVTPKTLIPVLVPGERVLCAQQRGSLTVLNVAGRVADCRGTTAQMNALGSSGAAVEGMRFFNTTNMRDYVRVGTVWEMVSGRLETYTPAAGVYLNGWTRHGSSPLTFAFDGVLVTLTGAVGSPSGLTYSSEIFASGTNPWPPARVVGGSLERFTGTVGDGAVTRNIIVNTNGSVEAYDLTTDSSNLFVNLSWRIT